MEMLNFLAQLMNHIYAYYHDSDLRNRPWVFKDKQFLVYYETEIVPGFYLTIWSKY